MQGKEDDLDPPPPPKQDWGFLLDFDEYLDFRFQILELSQFVTWPKAGGVDDQDPAFLEDLATYLDEKAYRSYARPDGPKVRLISDA